jgi:hypothetical protein
VLLRRRDREEELDRHRGELEDCSVGTCGSGCAIFGGHAVAASERMQKQANQPNKHVSSQTCTMKTTKQLRISLVGAG